MPPTSEITIRVVNSDNGPIEGAAVTGEGQPHETDIPLGFSGETDSNGKYNDMTYENEFTIEVDHPEYRSRTVESNHRGESNVVVELESAESDDEDDESTEGNEDDPPFLLPLGS